MTPEHEAEFQAAWEAEEAAWEERVQAKMQQLEHKAMLLALTRELDKQRARLLEAEARLVDAIEAVTKVRSDCLHLAEAIETTAKLAVAA